MKHHYSFLLPASIGIALIQAVSKVIPDNGEEVEQVVRIVVQIIIGIATLIKIYNANKTESN